MSSSSSSNAAQLLKSMNEKHKEICFWLDSIGFQGPRNYDINEKSIDILWTTMKIYQEKDREVTARITEMETKTETYKEKSSRLESNLKSIHLDSDHLSETTDALSHSLARIASHLEIEIPSNTSFCTGFGNLVTREMELELEVDEIEEEIENITKNIEETLIRMKQHQKVLNHLKEEFMKESESLKSGENDIHFIKKKAIQYQRKIDSLDKHFASIGLHKTLKHDGLMEMYKRLKLALAEMQKLQNNLDVYLNLPTNVSSAKVTIAEAKTRLANLENEIDKHIKDTFE